MLKLISFLYHDMIAKNKKIKNKKGKCKRSTPKNTNANVWETIQKKMAWDKKIVYKMNLPRPNSGEWSLLIKKKWRDRMALNHDYSLLHSPSTNMNFYVSRGLLLFLPLCTYLFFKHSFLKFENKTFNSHLIIRYRCWHGPFLWRN